MKDSAQDIERGGAGSLPASAGRRFPTYLRRCRLERRLSLRQVEKLSEAYPERISNSYLAYCETGRLLPALGKLITLSKVLGVPLQSFTERIETDLEGAAPPDLGPAATWAELRRVGIVEAEAGRLPAAYACFERALELAAAEAAPDPGVETDLRMDLAIVLKRMSRHYTARDLLEEVISRKGQDPVRLDRAMILLADVFREMGKLPLAALIGREAMERAARAGDDAKEAHAACLLGNALYDMGSVVEAAPYYEKALRHFRRDGDAASMICNMANLANCLVRCERGARFNEGMRLLAESEELARREGFARQLADILSYQGQAHALRGSRARTEKCFFRSNQIAREGGYHDIVFTNTWILREQALADGRRDEAADHLRTLRYLRGRVDNLNPEIRAYDLLSSSPEDGS